MTAFTTAVRSLALFYAARPQYFYARGLHPYQTWSSFWQRVGLMLAALVALEAILTWAFWDWTASSDLLVDIMSEYAWLSMNGQSYPGCGVR